MSCVGYGTFKTPADTAEQAVKEAIETGYRPIDTDAVYGNKEAIGLSSKRRQHKSAYVRFFNRGILSLPKSVHKERIVSKNIFDFKLTDEDMHKINLLPNRGGQCVDPDEVDF